MNLQKKTNQKLEFVYEIKPTNFSTLPDDKKIVALGRFFNIISSIQKPVRILMIKEPLTLEMGTDMRTLQIPRTYLVSEEPLEQFLQQTGLEYSVATNKPKWDIQEERLSFLKLKDGSLAKCYTLYGIP
ncbi:MAG: hypothetical protein QXE84_09255, partial [Candidatus Nitrosotenuis sp.]